MLHHSTNPDRVRGKYFRAAVLVSMFLPVFCQAQAPPPYTITTAAGQGGTAGFSGDGGAATSATLSGPAGLVFDSSGSLYIADSLNHRVRKITNGTISTAAGNGTAGFAGDGSSATASGTELNSPSGLAFDSSGNLFIADTGNYVLRKVSGGNIATAAGNNSLGAGFSGDLGPATSAQLNNPSGVAVDSAGNIYIADPGTNIVRIVCANQTPIACTSSAFGSSTFAAGDVNTFAGSTINGIGNPGYQGDGGAATGSLLSNPVAVTFDQAGNLYIADSGNNAVRKVDTNGIITTVAGTGVPGYSGDGGLATAAQLNTPKGVAVDSAGNIFIADSVNCVIRMVAADGTIYTIAGKQSAGPGFSGDGGPATSATLFFPSGLAVSGGSVYIADTQNNAIRLLTPAPQVPEINTGGVITAGAFGASTTVSPGSWIEIYGTYLGASTRTWGTADFNGSNAPTSLGGTSVTVGGQPAYVAYVSPGQVNVQVPSNITAGTQPLILKTASGTSAAYNLAVGSAPGLYAPPFLTIGGKQYAGALFANSSTWVLPAGNSTGLTSQPAAPGDTITLYGVGFGTVTPDIPAGRLVGPAELTSLTSPVQFMFDTTPATVSYQGLAPGLVGLYQFNVEVPDIAASDAVPLTFTQGAAGTQTLYTAVGN